MIEQQFKREPWYARRNYALLKAALGGLVLAGAGSGWYVVQENAPEVSAPVPNDDKREAVLRTILQEAGAENLPDAQECPPGNPPPPYALVSVHKIGADGLLPNRVRVTDVYTGGKSPTYCGTDSGLGGQFSGIFIAQNGNGYRVMAMDERTLTKPSANGQS